MNEIREQGGPAFLGGRLARLKDGTSFKEASGAAAVGRLVDATLNSLTTPPEMPPAPASPVRIRVSAAAACFRSATTSAAAAPGQQAPTEAAVPAHRRQAGPGRGAGRAGARAGPGRPGSAAPATAGARPTPLPYGRRSYGPRFSYARLAPWSRWRPRYRLPRRGSRTGGRRHGPGSRMCSRTGGRP
ncbi:hypothetical protein AB0O57_27825 [Streptomyces sp. NPDC091201]|uniref:hypothetical protein n=1 Tax=Streptomyces sp. NPDC091201 TaxID=3155190 RepID=UPI00341B55FE